MADGKWETGNGKYYNKSFEEFVAQFN